MMYRFEKCCMTLTGYSRNILLLINKVNKNIKYIYIYIYILKYLIPKGNHNNKREELNHLSIHRKINQKRYYE